MGVRTGFIRRRTYQEKELAVFEKLFPKQIDNTYRGYRIALVLLGLVLAIRALQSVMVIFNGPATVTGADGIPLDLYPADAAQTVLALFAQGSWWRLLFSFLGVLVLVRYRAAVPLMFVLCIASFMGAVAISQYIPLARVGTAPGQIVNRVMFGIMVVGLVLSLIDRRRPDVDNRLE